MLALRESFKSVVHIRFEVPSALINMTSKEKKENIVLLELFLSDYFDHQTDADNIDFLHDGNKASHH